MFRYDQIKVSYRCYMKKQKKKISYVKGNLSNVGFENDIQWQEMTSFTLAVGYAKPMKLTPELADIVGKQEATRKDCLDQLFIYIRKNNLQDPKNKAYFIPDSKMGKVFGQNKVRIMGMGAFVSKHLSQLK